MLNPTLFSLATDDGSPLLFSLWWVFFSNASSWAFHGGLLAALLFTTLLTLGVGLGVVVGYHRIMTHRACRLWRPLEVFIVFFGLPAGTPVQWVANHRRHHVVSDQKEDVHSPRHHGFWTAHAGWYLETKKTWPAVLYTFAGPLRTLFDGFWRPRTNQSYNRMAKDLKKDLIYGNLFSNKWIYLLIMLGFSFLPLGFIFLVSGLAGALYLWGWITIFYMLGDIVNSMAHASAGFSWGTAPWKSSDESRNIKALSLLSFGDSFHNAHHAFPRSARTGLLEGEFDLSWEFIRLCQRFRLAYDVYIPPIHKLRARLLLADSELAVGLEENENKLKIKCLADVCDAELQARQEFKKL